MGKILLGMLLGLVAHGSVSPAPTGLSAAASAEADRAWVELQPLLEFKRLDTAAKLSLRQVHEWQEQRALQLREQGLAFIEAFPADPRRWHVAWKMIKTQPPAFILSYGPNAERDYHDVVIDEAAAAAWKAKLAELERALRTAPDLPADVREAIDQSDMEETVLAALRADAGREPDWAFLTRTILDFAARYPASSADSQWCVSGAMNRFEASHAPAQSAAQWREFLATPNEALAAMAREKIRTLEAISGELELAFTAVDGREVDLKKLRGKVVLIDFWATWCGPCMAEMPNVKKIYAAYHELGFEIIGISCDVSPEHTKQAIARTGAQVWEFCQRNDMPWPQHYDGKKHNGGGNTLAARFGVTGIPATFLLNRRGEVVAMNLRGEKLEAEVKRVLGL
jgi:thiol-disulfide isomerase/thioredoxin